MLFLWAMVMWVCGLAEAGWADPSSLVGSNADTLVFTTLDGQYFKVADRCYAGTEKPGKPRQALVLNFMSSDCIPCKKEIPIFLNVARSHTNQPAAFFLVSTDAPSKIEALRRFLLEMRVDIETLRDPYRVACKKLGIEGTPRTLVINREGRIVLDLTGCPNDYEAVLRKAVAECGGKFNE